MPLRSNYAHVVHVINIPIFVYWFDVMNFITLSPPNGINVPCKRRFSFTNVALILIFKLFRQVWIFRYLFPKSLSETVKIRKRPSTKFVSDLIWNR